MHVEEQLSEITEDKCGDNHDEDEGEMVFVSPPISSPSYRKVYLDIEEGDGCKREDTDDHQAKPVVIIGDVEMVPSKLCNINEDIPIFIL